VTALDVERALAMRLSDDRWVPSTAHIVVLAIVLLLVGAALPRPFLIWWAMVIIACSARRLSRSHWSSRSPRRVWKWC